MNDDEAHQQEQENRRREREKEWDTVMKRIDDELKQLKAEKERSDGHDTICRK